ncbi:MAG TPA: N-(5'-phosphoribosyl)anthranilate isomerase [Verrucomicrobia bacterium]|nr:N-(5'-phosphoribosyl)anthranilate isomerase [Verrucomicrobiota bacterium]
MVDIKICGLTTLEDAQVALDAGADFLGFVLYPQSPRAVTCDTLARITSSLGKGARCVGVFVNSMAAEVRQTALDCGLAAVQIHGDEQAGDFLDMPVPVWRALRVDAGGCRPEPAAWPMAVRYVADAAVPSGYGGSGIKADWEQAATLAAQIPVMLAGGLTPANVAAAIDQVHPLGVDVSSGVECSPGRKSHAAVRAFVAAARAAGQ